MLLVLKALIPNDRSLSREESGLPAEVAYYTRALSLYNPFGNNFLIVPGKAAHYTQDPSNTQSFSAKNGYYRGFQLLCGHRQLATPRSQNPELPLTN